MTFSHKIASLGMYSNGLPIIKPQSQPKNQFSKGPFSLYYQSMGKTLALGL